MDERSGCSTDGKWRALSAAGNDAFHRGDDLEARTLYVLAVEEAERVLSLAKSGDRAAMTIAPVLHTIAYHNLAGLERRMGNAVTSRELLDRALGRLVETARDASLPVALRVRAVENLKHSLAEIVEHAPGTSPEALAPVVARAMDAWLCVRALQTSELPRPCERGLPS